MSDTNRLRETLTSQQDVIESLRSQITSWKEQNNQLHSQLKSIGNLEQQLEAAKLREAELTRLVSSQGIRAMQDLDDIETLKQERDAALSALIRVREYCEHRDANAGRCRDILEVIDDAVGKQPTAALAERDRVDKRVAEAE